MIIIALVLALVEKATTTWTWMNMFLMLMNVTSNPMEKGMRQQVQDQKLVSNFCNLLQETNETSNVKGVSRTHGVVKARDLIPCGYLKFILHSYRDVPYCICCYELSSPKK